MRFHYVFDNLIRALRLTVLTVRNYFCGGKRDKKNLPPLKMSQRGKITKSNATDKAKRN